GTPGSARGRRPSPRSSPPSPADSSGTSPRSPSATPSCAGGWPGCMPARVELQADRVGPEGRAREPGPLDGVLAFLDPLLRLPAPVVEGDHLLGATAEVRHDEADARVQLAGMPFDLRDHATRSTPALRLVAEARIGVPNVVRCAADR